MFKRLIASLVCLTFIFSNIQSAGAQPAPQQAGSFSINQLPVPGTMVGESAPFAPLALKGLIVNPQKPLEFQFIADTGKGPQDTASIKEEANQLVKYFLAGLTIPEGDLWVNLSPYEKDRMVPEVLGQTDLGRDLLAQDYILKQLTASLIYPEKDLGKEFWSRVYAKAQEQFGTTDVPVNTFNKVWILPDQAQVYENVNAAYVTKSTLKVMLDEDYLALQKHMTVHNGTDSIGSQIVREIVIPEITKEVNTGKNFAPLRQIYQALILAKWYKETIQNGLLDAVYTNKNKVAGVNVNDSTVKEQIYERYLRAYKKGAFNYIKDAPTLDGQVVPRKYFSGGTFLGDIPEKRDYKPEDVRWDGAMTVFTVGLVAAGGIVASLIGGAITVNIATKKKIQAFVRGEANVDEIIKLLDYAYARETIDKLVTDPQKKILIYINSSSSKDLEIKHWANKNLRSMPRDKQAVELVKALDATVEPLLVDLKSAEEGRDYKKYNRISDQLYGIAHPSGELIYKQIKVKVRGAFVPSESEAEFGTLAENGYWRDGYTYHDWQKVPRDQAMLQTQESDTAMLAVEEVGDEIIKAQEENKGKTTFIIMDGASGVGKTTILKPIKGYIENKGKKVIVVKRDDFIETDANGKPSGYDKPILKALLDSLKNLDQSGTNDEQVFPVGNVTKGGKLVPMESLRVSKGSIIIVDGARDLEDIISDYDFKRKILLLANDQIAKARKIGRQASRGASVVALQKLAGPSQWVDPFSGEADIVIWNNDLPLIVKPKNVPVVIDYDAENKKVVISRNRPDKEFVMKDYLLSNALQASNGIFIGNETKPRGVDHPVLAVPEITVFAVDKDQNGVDSRAVSVGNGSKGTADILKRLVELLKNAGGPPVNENSSIDKNLKLFLGANKAPFIAMDVDGTVDDLFTAEGQEILGCLKYLIETKGFKIMFVTKSGGPSIYRRIAAPLEGAIAEGYDNQVVFYTSAMMKKSRLSRNGKDLDLLYGIQGTYHLSTQLPPISYRLLSDFKREFPNKVEQTEGFANIKGVQAAHLFEIKLNGINPEEFDKVRSMVRESIEGSGYNVADAAMLINFRINWILSHNEKKELEGELRAYLAKQKYETLVELLKHKNTFVQTIASTTLKRYEPIIQKLKEKQPVEAKGTLLDYVEQAFRYSQDGDDFEVVFEPEQTTEEAYSHGNGVVDGYRTVIVSPEILRIKRGKSLNLAKSQTPRHQDNAALAKDLGGIDLNQINVHRTGRTVNVQFDQAQLSALTRGGFEGFTPVIINITPIQSPFQLLGINQAKEPELLAKV